MAAKFRYPTGVRPLLGDEAGRRKRVEARFMGLLDGAGFTEVVLPIIDYVEPYAQLIGREAARQSYRFVDREGELVSIRSDFTPMLARAVAPALTAAELPLRVSYRGDVIRCQASRLGANREMFQIGAEIIGSSPGGDAEALQLATRLAGAFGIRPLVVYNDVTIVETLVAAAASDTAAGAIRTALLSKRTGDLASLDSALEPAALHLVARLAAGTATLEDVAGYPPTAAAAQRLRAVEGALVGTEGAEFVLHLDDIDDGAGYYTGIRFRLFGADRRTRIAQGGRYDDLYGRFGTGAPAIGFTFTVDDIEEGL
jgi:ATP phosphoribosyltransferase regulatory subunit